MGILKVSGWRAGLIGAAVPAAASPAAGSGAPQALLGKHIRMQGTQIIVRQPIAGGQSIIVKQSVEGIVYVSSLGRLFTQGAVHGGTSASLQQSPGRPSPDGLKYRWQRDVLVGSSSAGERKVAFDPSFRTCTTSFALKPHATALDTDRKQWLILSLSEEATCAIQDGNPFSGQ